MNCEVDVLASRYSDLDESHVRDAHPEIAWRQIIGTRNRMAHGSLGLDDDIIWGIIQIDIPDLLAALGSVLQEE